MNRPSDASPTFTVLTVEIDVGEPFDIGSIPSGRRTAVPILGGTFEGPRLRGVVCAVGLDWSTQYSDGSCSMRASALLRTEDGALIALHYDGRHASSSDAGESTGGMSSLEASREMTMSCRFECGDERYDWLDGALAVADGRCGTSGITCRLFAVAR